MNEKKVIISGHHVELTDALKQTVLEKVEKLFRHEDDIIRIRVELEVDTNVSKQDEFIAKGHIEINGPSMNAMEASDDLYKSIDSMADKLDRQLRRRARLSKTKRRNPQKIDLPANLPKVGQ